MATTIDFDAADANPYIEDGFSIADARIVNGNCPISGPCLALNNNEASVLTRVDGGLFDLDSMSFRLLGNGVGNTLFVGETGAAPENIVSFSVPAFAKNTTHFYDFGAVFEAVSSITFYTTNGGNARIDGVNLTAVQTASPIPLPAAAWMLLAGLGGIAALSRRKAA
ncbi:VPLPA-CTERM sorting domain-containing protein [Rubrimonas cliftonensis]|uniref:VPLPA-CTERM protein sorting domain-containing protein n=1 Tax=Rubrimonas cliftonensis TaxID=89524 RepID=A0A1H4DRN8_9RHOB|nr:VPLPA-CTERM sorting domain-containing protein [Rubrimonas cliftonensis]SEA75445.1 VPLPA-CTERM protein sorting domain-containing protein [Rubrimonas cliftonensis]